MLRKKNAASQPAAGFQLGGGDEADANPLGGVRLGVRLGVERDDGGIVHAIAGEAVP